MILESLTPRDPLMRHVLGYIRRVEKVQDGAEWGRILMDARKTFPDVSDRRIDEALRSLYRAGFIERRYDGRYEIPEH